MKLIRDFGPILTADISSSIVGSIFWLYLATILNKNNYGELQLFISIAGMAVGFAVIANSNVMIIYEVKQKDLRRTLFLISFFTGIIISLILFIVYSRFDIILLIFGMMIEEMTLGYFLGKKLFAKYAIFLIAQKILMIILGIMFYFVIGVEGILYGIGLSYMPLAIIVIKGFKESKLNFSLFKKNFWFVINIYASRLVVFSRKNLDKILIMPILGVEVLGEYALAFQVYLIMAMFSTICFKFLLLNDAEKINSKKFRILVFFVSIIIAVSGIMIAPVAIPKLFPEYIRILTIIPIFSLAIIPNAVMTIYSSKFLGDEKSRFILIGGLINTIIYLLLVIFLGTTYGLFGLSMSFLIGIIINAIFLIFMSRAVNKISIE